jgi:hypothetical protein
MLMARKRRLCFNNLVQKGATLIPKTLMQLAIGAGVALLVGCAAPAPDPAATAQAAAEKAQMQQRATKMHKVVGP